MSRLVPRRHVQFLLALLAFGCLVAVAAPTRASAVRSQQIIDLGTLGGESSAAAAVNASGAVTGWSDTAAGPVDAFLWTRRAGMIDLGNLGGNDTFATAINDRGQVVGYCTFGRGGPCAAFSWTRATGMINLGSLGGAGTVAQALNNRGDVVGTSAVAANVGWHAFVWTEHGGMVDLGTLGGANSSALAINQAGDVVGESTTSAGESHGFLWTPASGMSDLGELPGCVLGSAVAVNDALRVIGYCVTTGVSELREFSWTPQRGLTSLGTLGGTRTYPAAVNGGGHPTLTPAGETVGASFLTGDQGFHAFSWTERTGLVDLGTLGGLFSGARAVNSRGLVVGDSTTSTGMEHAFGWTPQDGMVDLGSLGSNSWAQSVNDSGEIAGTSFLSDGLHTHAVYWQW